MNALIIGKNPIFFDVADSTNSILLNFCRKNKVDSGTWICAFNQIAGRGQQGAYWYSETGNSLTASLALKLLGNASDPHRLPIMNMAIANGIFDFLAWKNMPQPTIKWPNDLLVDGRKIAGVLLESLVEGNKIKWLVIGIGLNLNQKTFPKHLPFATSLFQHTHIHYNLNDCLSLISQSLESWIRMFYQGQDEHILRIYNQRLFGLGYPRKYAKFLSQNESFIGVLKGVNSEGKACIFTDENGDEYYSAKEIIWDLN
jgi:BirA family biotin operon repressor/biotin-[acetyl-CoA-carboxylase] ligase